MKLSKMFSGKNKKMVNILLILGLVVVAVVLYKYNFSKFSFRDSMQGKLSANSMALADTSEPTGAPSNGTESVEQSVQGTPSLQQKPFLSVSGMASPKPQSSCNNQPLMDPKELLPQDANSEWSKINPASGDLKNLNMLSAGHHFGINTVGSSLRNANLQLRSEPQIPQVDVGPWNNTTIESDNLRRPLEIGAKE